MATRDSSGALLGAWLDALDATGRWALLKLVTGALRVGVSARLAKTALAEGSAASRRRDRGGLARRSQPPYPTLFAWLEGAAPRPELGDRPTFTPADAGPAARGRRTSPSSIPPTIAPNGNGTASACSSSRAAASGGSIRAPATISARRFPTSARSMLDEDVVLDGELLVMRDGEVAPFNDLQQRLNRKVATPKMLRDYPGLGPALRHPRRGGEDLRAAALRSSAARGWKPGIARAPRPRMRPLAAGAVRRLGRAARVARRRARARHRRADAEARRFSLCLRPAERAVVQMEARCADHRLPC